MIEAVGHEYMEEFFGCCESVMANDGLLVLQVCVYTTIKLLLYLGYNGMIFILCLDYKLSARHEFLICE